jgi:hypothetical protein
MPVIDPHGLLEGKRLAACSDLAQYLWPRFFVGADNFGRMELYVPAIMVRCFHHIHKPPTEADLLAIIGEYDANCLAIVYRVGTSVWLQFITQDKYLSRWKTSDDKRSPEPPMELVQQFAAKYEQWKQQQGEHNHSDTQIEEILQKNFGRTSEELPKDLQSSAAKVGDGIKCLVLGSACGLSSSSSMKTHSTSVEDSPLVPLDLKTPAKRSPQDYVDHWNETRGPLAAVLKLTTTRRKHLAARIAEGLTPDQFKAVIAKIHASPFLLGDNERRWRCTFDFVVGSDDHVQKILEGEYDRAAKPKPVLREMPNQIEPRGDRR